MDTCHAAIFGKIFKYVAGHISTGSGCRITGLAQLHDLVSGEITFQGSIQSTHDQWDSGIEYNLCRLRICVDVEFRCRGDVSAFCCAACKYDFSDLILYFRKNLQQKCKISHWCSFDHYYLLALRNGIQNVTDKKHCIVRSSLCFCFRQYAMSKPCLSVKFFRINCLFHKRTILASCHRNLQSVKIHQLQCIFGHSFYPGTSCRCRHCKQLQFILMCCRICQCDPVIDSGITVHDNLDLISHIFTSVKTLSPIL